MKTILFVFLLVSLGALAGSIALPGAYKKFYPKADKERYRKLIIYRPAAITISMVLLAFSLIGLQNNKYGDVSADQTASAAASDQSSNLDKYDVTKVLKADAVNVSLNDTPAMVKLIGLATFKSTNAKQDSCYQKQAGDKLNSLLRSKKVELESDDALIDKNNENALLRYLRINDENINEDMIASGYARASSGIANYKYRDDFLAAQTEAKNKGLGLWSAGICKQPAPAKPKTKASPAVINPSSSKFAGHVSKDPAKNMRESNGHGKHSGDNEKPGSHGQPGKAGDSSSCDSLPIIGPLLNTVLQKC